jgi:hypothetical protein
MRNDSGALSSSAPALATSPGEETRWRDDGGPLWLTVAQAAERIHRTPRTVLDWLSAFPQLPRRTGTVVRHRLKRKCIFLRGDAVHFLTEAVTFQNAWARRNPPTR